MLKKIVISILLFEARLILGKYKPRIIGVTGTVGKTSTKDAIARVLCRKYKLRASSKSYNSELGLPLTIIGADNKWSSAVGWLSVILRGVLLVLSPSDYPEVLVLEMGVDSPGDMDIFAKVVELDVAVVTMLGDLPVHVEAFANPEELREEKLNIINALKPSGTLVLNYDDAEIVSRRKYIESKTENILTYGFDENSNVHGSDYVMENGVSFKVKYGGHIVPVRMPNVLGQHYANIALSALAVGTLLGVNLVSGVESLHALLPPNGRLRMIDGVNGARILDDSYNSSPIASRAALDVLAELTANGRKIAVLGDMRELGDYSIDAHRKLGRAVVGVADILITVGDEARFIADEACDTGFDDKRVFRFKDVWEAMKIIRELIKSGDLVLVKGSQAVRLERLVAVLMKDKTQKKKLLVRQGEEWERR